MKRSKNSKRAALSSRTRAPSGGSGRNNGPRGTRGAQKRESPTPSSEPTSATQIRAGAAIGEPFSKLFNLQRKLLRAGADAALSAVDNPASRRVKEGVTESLQGGLRKLEEVFDQRVAAALNRLGMPSPGLLNELIQRVDALTAATSVTAKRRKRK